MHECQGSNVKGNGNLNKGRRASKYVPNDVKHTSGGCETGRLGEWRHWVCGKGGRVVSCNGADRVTACDTSCKQVRSRLMMLHRSGWRTGSQPARLCSVRQLGRVMAHDTECGWVIGSRPATLHVAGD